MTHINDIPSGKGKIVDLNGLPVAVFNDNGSVKCFSTVCPHAGCDVEWNDSENTWDCPCHGSRFEAFGKMMQGPARRDLDPVNVVVENGEIRIP